MTEVALIAAAYLAGSLPFGYWLVRIFRHADIRTLGSHNTGMTNVWRNFGWRFGVATLVLDVAKGALPALAALHWSGPLTASIAGIVAMLGHGYPLLLGFGGGKGVATGAGAALALFPAGVGLAALTWAIAFFSLRYASLASLIVERGVPDRRDRARPRVARDRVRSARIRVRGLPPPRQHRPPASRHGAARALATRVLRTGFVTLAAWIVTNLRPHWGCARTVAQG